MAMKTACSFRPDLFWGTYLFLAGITTAWLCACGCTGSDDDDGSSGGTNGNGNVDAATSSDDGTATPVKTDIVDLLFVIDNSGSMKEEQARLCDALPRMLRILTSGDLDSEDNGGVPEQGKDFPAVEDLHVAVVSTDMGLPGVEPSTDPEGKCRAGFGDNGFFQHAPNPAGDPDLTCPDGDYPLFLSYQQGQDIEKLAADLQCLTALGTGGCGYEMQLEAPLKALWPADPGNLTAEQKDLGITFLLDDPPHGDREHVEFLRGTTYHPTQSDRPSMLAVILLTDEEDCSAGAKGKPLLLESAVGAFGTCRYNLDELYTVDRYVNAFRKLRPGQEQLVVFAAITGVPPTDPAEADFDGNSDGTLDDDESQAFFQALLDHPLMQETSSDGTPNWNPACTVTNPVFNPNDPESEQFLTKAYPARRITEVARGFGANGVVQSICQEKYDGAFDRIIRAISSHLGE
jgi:hypothetical protein